MKKYIVLLALVLLPAGTAFAASADYYIKIPDIDGESTESSAAPTTFAPTRVAPSIDDQEKPQAEFKVEEGEALKNTGVEPDEIDFMPEDEGQAKGNVEMEWKVEKGEKANAHNLEALLGAGNKISEDHRSEVASVILAGLAEGGQPVETLSLNYGKVKTKVKQKVKLFGFIPVNARATVEIGEDGKAETSFSWWTFLASGKNKQELGEGVALALEAAISDRSAEINAILSTEPGR